MTRKGLNVRAKYHMGLTDIGNFPVTKLVPGGIVKTSNDKVKRFGKVRKNK